MTGTFLAFHLLPPPQPVARGTSVPCVRVCRATLVFDFIEKALHVLFVIVGYIMKVAPIGAFGAMALAIGKYGLLSRVSLGALMSTFYATWLFFFLVVPDSIARFHGFSIWKFIKYIQEEVLIVLRTSSGESVLPRMMAKLENLGVPKSMVGLVVLTGYSSTSTAPRSTRRWPRCSSGRPPTSR